MPESNYSAYLTADIKSIFDYALHSVRLDLAVFSPELMPVPKAMFEIEDKTYELELSRETEDCKLYSWYTGSPVLLAEGNDKVFNALVFDFENAECEAFE